MRLPLVPPPRPPRPPSLLATSPLQLGTFRTRSSASFARSSPSATSLTRSLSFRNSPSSSPPTLTSPTSSIVSSPCRSHPPTWKYRSPSPRNSIKTSLLRRGSSMSQPIRRVSRSRRDRLISPAARSRIPIRTMYSSSPSGEIDCRDVGIGRRRSRFWRRCTRRSSASSSRGTFRCTRDCVGLLSRT